MSLSLSIKILPSITGFAASLRVAITIESSKVNISYTNPFYWGNAYFRDDYPKNMSLIETKVSTTLQRGDIVLFHSLLLHRANANQTNKPKISFVYTIKGASTKAIEGTRSAKYPEIYLENS